MAMAIPIRYDRSIKCKKKNNIKWPVFKRKFLNCRRNGLNPVYSVDTIKSNKKK